LELVQKQIEKQQNQNQKYSDSQPMNQNSKEQNRSDAKDQFREFHIRYPRDRPSFIPHRQKAVHPGRKSFFTHGRPHHPLLHPSYHIAPSQSNLVQPKIAIPSLRPTARHHESGPSRSDHITHTNALCTVYRGLHTRAHGLVTTAHWLVVVHGCVRGALHLDWAE